MEGTGGAGYTFADEYPTNQYPAGDPVLSYPTVYPRGTAARAPGNEPNQGSGVFNMFYEDSEQTPNSTVFGTIDDTDLSTLGKIAAMGVA
jgi:peptidyl-prolyl cis-trans isomerase B (cyclophilin B)